MSELYLFVSIILLGVAVLLNMCMRPSHEVSHHTLYTRMPDQEPPTPVVRKKEDPGTLELTFAN